MHPKNMTTNELIHEASLCDGHSLMMSEALAYWLGEALEEMQGAEVAAEVALQGYVDMFGEIEEVKTQWTVVLLYPDYLADTFGQDIYRACVTADNEKLALYRARMDANDDNPGTNDPTDFELLALFQGWHEDRGYMT